MKPYYPYSELGSILKNIDEGTSELTGEPYEDLMAVLVKMSEYVNMLESRIFELETENK